MGRSELGFGIMYFPYPAVAPLLGDQVGDHRWSAG
jgi:hypothetical protein